MAVSKRLRYEILRRDQHTCRYCGASAPAVPLRVDHVTPVALGGTDTPDNLVTSCEPCNSGKSSATVDSAVVAAVSDDALRWATAMEQAAANLQELEKPKDEYRDAFLAEWNRWTVGDQKKPVELPVDWKPAVERFRVAGIPVWMWADIVDVGMANEKVKPENTFRYCCGVAWNKVTALQAEARSIVGAKADNEPRSSFTSALISAAIEVWRKEAGDDVTAEQEAQLTASLMDATRNELEPEEIIKAVRYAAWFGACTVDDGLVHAATDHDAIEAMRWENAWSSTCGNLPSADEGAAFEQWRTALRQAGASDQLISIASAVAGYSLSCVPHFGIPLDMLEAAGINGKQQTAEDFWALAFVATAARWPSEEERRKFRQQLERLTIDGGYLIFDANAAAVAAGAAQEADLYWNVPRKFSALLAAATPLQGGSN
ncbi:HNH endonuclease [Streptomyces sp. NPDC006173]|uniref:HNH endonuclease n=1 Tax=Streptomyces sp. NPDC006173 TaxID=3155349 RepID=UPI00341128F0